MKKLFAIAVAITVFATSELFAQTGAANANVYLRMISGPSLTKVSDLTLPNSVVGVTSVSVNPITDGSAAAYIILSANASTPVTVTFSSSPLVLAGQPTIPFTGTLAGNSTDVQASATDIISASSVTANSSGQYYFWAGGTATPIPAQGPGNYVGSFTLDVSY